MCTVLANSYVSHQTVETRDIHAILYVKLRKMVSLCAVSNDAQRHVQPKPERRNKYSFERPCYHRYIFPGKFAGFTTLKPASPSSHATPSTLNVHATSTSLAT
jgi:hypothetical protein